MRIISTLFFVTTPILGLAWGNPTHSSATQEEEGPLGASTAKTVLDMKPVLGKPLSAYQALLGKPTLKEYEDDMQATYFEFKPRGVVTVTLWAKKSKVILIWVNFKLGANPTAADALATLGLKPEGVVSKGHGWNPDTGSKTFKLTGVAGLPKPAPNVKFSNEGKEGDKQGASVEFDFR